MRNHRRARTRRARRARPGFDASGSLTSGTALPHLVATTCVPHGSGVRSPNWSGGPMRDIGQRIQRYRLSRYAPPEEHHQRRWRWVWLGVALWLAWVGVLSDHNFYRLWRLGRDRAHTNAELARTRAQIADL